MNDLFRTHTCGELSIYHVGQRAKLAGWVHRIRDHGGLRFVDLRDRYGITQVVLGDNEQHSEQDGPPVALPEMKPEYCLAIEGVVRGRPEEMRNPDMATGDIELVAEQVTLLSRSETPPFKIDTRTDAREELRQRWRYLDLRSLAMQRNLRLRHEVVRHTRAYLYEQGFYEIETPSLIRSTPEGARDFLVASRLQPGHFWALPQSPQLFKQLLMVGGFDRYFQIAHCFRDEDARGDRQIEHTQIDIELSFITREQVFAIVEGMLAHIFAHTRQQTLKTPFTRLTHHDAMERYGSDKPDLRFGLELQDCAGWAAGCDFAIFRRAIEQQGVVKALVVSGDDASGISRREIGQLEEAARTYGAHGLAWTRVAEDGLTGGIAKFLAAQQATIIDQLHAGRGDLLLFVADTHTTACRALGAVRLQLGHQLGLIAADSFHFAWIIDFPLFEWNADEGRFEPSHHPFSMPQARFIDSLEDDPAAVLGDLYDLVCNGYELASGSIRVHDADLQQRIFAIIGISPAEAERRFGFLLEALRYGAPAAWRHCPRSGSSGHADGRRGEHPRGHRLSQEPSGRLVAGWVTRSHRCGSIGRIGSAQCGQAVRRGDAGCVASALRLPASAHIVSKKGITAKCRALRSTCRIARAMANRAARTRRSGSTASGTS